MPKNIILNNQKNSFTRKNFRSEKLRKWPKKGQKWPFFCPRGPNFDPSLTIFCKSFLNMHKNIILKNQKKSKKLRKRPRMAEFRPFFHKFLQITSKNAFLPHVQTAYLWLNPWVGIGQRASVDMHPVDCTVWGFLKNLRLPIPGRMGYFYVSIAASRAPTVTMGSP